MTVELRKGFLIFEGQGAIRLDAVQRIRTPRSAMFDPPAHWISIDLVLANEFKQPQEHQLAFPTIEAAWTTYNEILGILRAPYRRESPRRILGGQGV